MEISASFCCGESSFGSPGREALTAQEPNNQAWQLLHLQSVQCCVRFMCWTILAPDNTSIRFVESTTHYIINASRSPWQKGVLLWCSDVCGTLLTKVRVPMCEQGGMNVAGTLALESCLSTSLPSLISVKDPAIEVLALLRILYGISKYWHSLYLVCTSFLLLHYLCSFYVCCTLHFSSIIFICMDVCEWLQQADDIHKCCPYLSSFVRFFCRKCICLWCLFSFSN